MKPKPPVKTGRRIDSIRWTAFQMAQEFGVDYAACRRKIKTSGEIPGPDECFSTMQCVTILLGSTQEELRKAQIEDTKESAELKKVKRSNLLRENIPSIMVEKVWADYIVDLRQKIQCLNIPSKDRADILQDLQKIPLENYFTGVNTQEKEEDEME